MAIADMKVSAPRSYRVWTRLESLSLANMFGAFVLLAVEFLVEAGK